jgi:membrane protein implicated in regulation of membrane protease activity
VNWSDLDPAWYWLVGAALLAATELVIPGVFLAWIAAAALLTALLTFATGFGLPAQLVMFGIASLAMVLLGRRAYGRMSQATADPLLNDRGARLVGRTVTVVVAIEGGEGRVKVGDSIWAARGPDAPEGARVRITGTSGSCLLVAPQASLQDLNSER